MIKRAVTGVAALTLIAGCGVPGYTSRAWGVHDASMVVRGECISTKEKDSAAFFKDFARHYNDGWRLVYFESHTAGGRNKQIRTACFEKPTGERVESLMPPPPVKPAPPE